MDTGYKEKMQLYENYKQTQLYRMCMFTHVPPTMQNTSVVTLEDQLYSRLPFSNTEIYRHYNNISPPLINKTPFYCPFVPYTPKFPRIIPTPPTYFSAFPSVCTILLSLQPSPTNALTRTHTFYNSLLT